MFDIVVLILYWCVLLSDFMDQALLTIWVFIEDYQLVEKKNIRWAHLAGTGIFGFFLYVDIRAFVFLIFKIKGWF